MKKLAVLIFTLISFVFITKQVISPVIAEEACYVNFLPSTKWLTQNTALIDIGADGYTGEEANTIEIKYGNNNWISIVKKDKCDTDPHKSEVPYNNDTCMEKVSGGHFQYGMTADQQTQTYTPNYEITVQINCGASKTINFPPPPPPPTIAPTVAPTPLPADVTQYVTSVCLEPYTIHETQAGCPADYKIINNWGENGLESRCYDWNYENVLYSHVLQLRSKIALNKNFPTEIFRRTTLGFEGNSDNQTATWCAADKNYEYACNITQSATGTRFDSVMFRIMDKSYGEVNTLLVNSASGILTLPHVRSYTGSWRVDDLHYFFALQKIVQANPTSTPQDGQQAGQTDDPALRLASFTPTPTPAPTPVASGNSYDCLSIFWDPMGKVIDTQYLEPIHEATVTLTSKNALGILAPFSLVDNPSFINPWTTSLDGSFSFFVPAGTYYLNTQKPNFTFPINAQSLLNAKQKLLVNDPSGEYIDTAKLYNDPSEPIIEKEGVTEVRHMVMEPPQGYEGTSPSITSYNQILNQNSQQIIFGVVSHPKAFVRAYYKGGQIAQTSASPNGQFKLTIEGTQIPQNAQEIQLRVQKIAFGNSISNKTEFSKMYNITLLPSHIAGFAFNSDYSVAPGALVEVIVPELNDLVYVSTYADTNGFARIPNKNMPPFPYLIRVRNPKNFATLSIQKPKEFIALNKTYFTNEQANPYNEKDTIALPSVQTLNQIQRESKKNKTLLAQGKLAKLTKETPQAPTPTTGTDQQKSNTNRSGFLAALLIIIILVPVGAGFIVLKSRSRGTEL